MWLHVDCNSFYANCEVSLRPDLQGKPVVVANCNEAGGGIILALTKQAKALGLKRGNPVFQVKDILNKNNVAVFPANLKKYVDISRRIMQLVKDMELLPDFKQYSVDEFFGEIPSAIIQPEDLRNVAAQIKKHIEHCTGIPVSCGIAATYTLAKVATSYAKKYDGYKGVCVLMSDKITVALANIPIADVWGIGRRSAPKLEEYNIKTALDFYNKPEFWVRKIMNINGVRTWRELHGEPSVSIDNPPRQKSIVHSRTFTYMTSDITTLHSYIAEYAFAASRKLRDQHSVCLSVGVFINTNAHREDLDQYRNIATTSLSTATCDARIIAKAACEALDSIFLPGYQYKSAGVILSDICSDEAIQLDLFNDQSENIAKSKRLMSAIDSLTTKYGMDSVKLASQAIVPEQPELKNFQPMKNETTNINDIINVK